MMVGRGRGNVRPILGVIGRSRKDWYGFTAGVYASFEVRDDKPSTSFRSTSMESY